MINHHIRAALAREMARHPAGPGGSYLPGQVSRASRIEGDRHVPSHS
jgi:hypothetical protein